MSATTLQSPITPTWRHPAFSPAKQPSNAVQNVAVQNNNAVQNVAVQNVAVQNVAVQVLLNSGRRPLCYLSCRVDGKTAQLTGIVPSYFLKQMAQELIRRVEGIERIVNEIEVTNDQEPLA